MSKEGPRLNVGFVFDDSLDSTDGVSQYVKTLGSWLTSRGHTVSYLVGETKMHSWAGGEVYSLSKNRKVTFNRNKLSIPLPVSRKKIKKLIQGSSYDILHVQAPYSPFMAGRIINAAEPSTAVIGTFHILPAGISSTLGSYILHAMYGNSLKRFDKFFSVSAPAGEFAQKTFGIHSQILPNVIEPAKFKANISKKNNRQEIVFLGRLVKRKGCTELLEAYRLARRQGLKARLLIAGAGPEQDRLQKFALKSGIGNDVEFLGFISEDEKPKLLARADIACFPSTGGESFGIVLIEAMAAGSKVVLGGDNPGYRSVLGGRPELLINPKNTAEFAAILCQLLSDDRKIASIGGWLKSEVKKYDVNHVGVQLEEAYFSAIAKRRQNRP